MSQIATFCFPKISQQAVYMLQVGRPVIFPFPRKQAPVIPL